MDFSMQETFSEIGKEGQEKLQSKTVSIVGLGGIGATVAQILVRNGINVRLVDKGRVLDKDVPRQTLYRISDITKFKAKQAKKNLEEINKDIKIRTFHEDLTENNVFLLDADIIIDASNNLKTSQIVNVFALEKKIPLIYTNYAGAKGHVLILDRSQSKKKGPCVECLLDKLKLPTTEKAGVYSPTTTLIASLVASAAMKNILGVGNTDKLLTIDEINTEIRHSTVEKNKKCPVCTGK